MGDARISYLLAGAFKLFGTYTLNASIAIRSLNILFSALTCYPIIQLGKKLFGGTAGAVAGWIWALYPNAVALPITWAWDMSLAALLLTTLLWIGYALEEHDETFIWSLYGFLWDSQRW